MKKLLLAFFALPFVGLSQATDLFISEYGEGAGGSKKYIEIYNGTGVSVNLDGYQLWRSSNGGGWQATTLAFTAGTTLADGETWIVANNLDDTPIYDQLSSSFIQFNGDDAIGLAKNIAGTWTAIDVFGNPSNDPGTGWSVAGVANATVDKILIRKATVCSPNADWAASFGTDAASSEWEIAVNTYNDVNQPAATAGNHTANCVIAGCNITSADLTALTCNNNTTTSDPADDYISFSLNPTGNDLGATYTVSVSSGTITPTTGTYGAATTFQLQDGSAGAGNVTVTITDADESGCTLDVAITDPGSCSSAVPVITATPATLTGFNHQVGTPSTSQPFTVSGIALSDDITVTAPTGFEVSLDNTTFTTSVTLAPVSGTVAATTVHARGNSAVYGPFSGNIIASSTGADNDTVAVSGFADDYVYYTIDQIDGIDANGAADSLGVLVTITGVLHCMDFRAGSGYNMAIIDGSAKGMYIFATNDVSGYTTPMAGDSIQVKGIIDQYNGLLQVRAHAITLLESGVATNAPIVVTALGEQTENQYITLENVTLVTPIATFPTTNTNLDVTDGTTTFQIRILTSTNLGGTPAPQGPFNVTGIGTQFDSSSPYTSGYQLLPCGTDAIEIVCAGANMPNLAVTTSGMTATATATDMTYQWINCADNSPISGATNRAYTATAAGSYAVIISNGTCSDTSACVALAGVSVESVELGQSIVAYPNPVNDQLTINNYSEMEVTYTITDINGKVVAETTTMNTVATVNTLSWNKGVYFVTFNGANNATHTLKVIK